MCGIVGYIGKNYGRSFVIEGLRRLEYRGYDAAGFACLNPSDVRILYEKATGRLSNLEAILEKNPINGHLAIGHTRWSTHGSLLSTENAHPHFDCEKKIALVHNGIIENHHELREQLTQMGHVFHSQTDSEIIAHLFESMLISHKTLKAAVIELVNTIQGAYAFACILQDYPDQLLVVRKRSPLCLGIGDNEVFVSSDALSFTDKTKKTLFLPDGSFALIHSGFVELYDFAGSPLAMHVQDVEIDWDLGGKRGFDHYMLKEIFDQKNAISSTVGFLKAASKNLWEDLGVSIDYLSRLEHIYLTGCGTSWHAARMAQFFFEHICNIPTYVYLASEFRYMPFFPERNSIFIAMSQSGETADTLEAMRMVATTDVPTVALTNVASSTLMREAGGFLLMQAGREFSVASTKTFATQLTTLYWLAHYIGLHKRLVSQSQLDAVEAELRTCGEVLENTVENYRYDIVRTFAPRFAQYSHAIFLGRHISYPFAMEAALKLKEIAYIFSQSYPAGEIKHGPLALIDSETPVFIFSHQDELIYQKLLSNAQEIKARDGIIVSFAFEGQRELCEISDVSFTIPLVKPLLGQLAMTGLMQFMVYAIAKQLRRPIDNPRNLAKSLTVE